MATKIDLKRSATPGKVPSTRDLDLGELALNTYDGIAYMKKNVNGVESIVSLAGSGSGGGGGVSTVSIVAANGFSGTVANPTTTPAITLTTTITGLLKGNGTSIFAATPGTDYITSTAGTASWAQNAVSASYALTASYSTNALVFPYTGSAIITGSLIVSSSAAFNTVNTTPVTPFVSLISKTGQNGLSVWDNGSVLIGVNAPGNLAATAGYGLYVDPGYTAGLYAGQVDTMRVIATGAYGGRIRLNPSNIPAYMDFQYNNFGANIFLDQTNGYLTLQGGRYADQYYGLYFGNLITGLGMTMFGPTLNVSIGNSTTDSGYKLDVSGSMRVQGNTTVTGSLTVSGSSTFTNIGPAIFSGSVTSTGGFTGSLFGTASYAISASYAPSSVSASYTVSSSYAISASNSTTASYVLNAISASNAISSSYAVSASYASNGGVTQLFAGANISLSPTNGLGQVTITSTGGGGGTYYNTSTGSYGSFYDTTTQNNPVVNIPRSMSLNTTDITNGVLISGSSSPYNTYIKFTNAGIYNLQFSAQVSKTNPGGTNRTWFWLRRNGSDLAQTNTEFDLSQNGQGVAAWNWFINVSANDYYQIIWSADATDIQLTAYPSPSYGTAVPSVIVTANRIDTFLSNTGSFSGSFTGTLYGTSSNATTASYVTGSIFTNSNSAASASYAQTASYVLNAISASYAATASYANNFTVAGTLTAQTLVVQTVSSSVVYSSGSNIFGNSLANTQQLTGSVSVTGSLLVNNSSVILTNQTSSMSVATASYVLNAISASYANTAANITATSNSTLITLSSLSLPYSQLTGTPSLAGYVTSVTGTSPIASSGGTTPVISISQATTSTNGYLSSTDWNTFNNKQAALNGTGFVKISGTTISYDNSAYYLASNPSGYLSSVSLTTNVTGTLPIANGGTAATTAINARTNLGLAIGTDVLAYRTFGTAANNNTGDFYANGSTVANSTLWNGYAINLATYGTNAGDFLNYDNSAGIIKPFSTAQIQTKLGLGSYAYRSSGLAELTGANFTGLVQMTYQGTINTTTPGTGTYGLHFAGQTTSDYANGLTFNGGSGGAQAGIYVQGSGAYGTKMYIATTDNYTTGAKTAISIDHTGLVNITRAALQQGGNQVLHAGNYNSYSPTLTGTGASGTWGINITGTAASISGFNNPTTAATANTIVYRDSNAYIFAQYFNAPANSASPTTSAPTSMIGRVSTSDKYYYDFSQGAIQSFLGLGSNAYTSTAYLPLAGGTMSGKIYAPSTGTGVYDGAFEIRETGYVSNGQSAWGYSPAISFHWGNRFAVRLGFDYQGYLAVDDVRFLNANNYNSYAPTLTGTGASGTWGINITGSSGTTSLTSVDNGVVYGRSGLQFAQSNGPAGNTPTIHQTPTTDWWHVLRMNHGNNAGYYADLAVSMTTNLGLSRRVISNGVQLSNWVTILDALNYNSYSPTLTGTGASGTWGISISGNAATATYATTSGTSTFVASPDGGRNPSTTSLPNTNPRIVRFDFAERGYITGATGNYAGVMTYTPWDGTTGSTGDSSYQLAFCNYTGVNASGLPGLAIRKGIDSTWNSTWYQLWHNGNLTNLNQLTNGPGYITGYTETDTLASVTARGSSTSTNVSINGTVIGTDQTFGNPYRTFAFGSNSNSYNRIFGATDATDGIYINAATGQGINFRVNGGGANVVSIPSTGNVLIGATSDNGSKLQIKGNVSVTGNVTATGGGFDSDLTLKDITTRDLSKHQIANKISAFKYKWKDQTKSQVERFGYGAQELLEIIPEAVYKSGETYAVDYTQVHTVLIDENTKRINELEKEIKQLKDELGKFSK